jgi:hypothetical protein
MPLHTLRFRVGFRVTFFPTEYPKVDGVVTDFLMLKSTFGGHLEETPAR